MKKVFLLCAFVLSIMTATATANLNLPGEGGDPSPASAPATVTITGTWHVTDMKFLVTPPGQKLPKQADVTQMVTRQNAVYEFTTDGKVVVTASGKSTAGTYKKVGSNIETIGPNGEKETYEIIKLTDKALTVKVKMGKIMVMMERM